MFWRRRKLPEDEPLVPHGLISQAMEEEGSPELPPDMWDNSPKDVQQSPAEPVEMRLRVSAPVQSSQAEPLPEQGRISPPLKWPRVDESEIARRAQGIDTAVSFPYRKPIVSAAAPRLDQFEPQPEIAEPAKLELVDISPAPDPVPAVSIPSAQSEKFRKLLSRMRELRLPTFEPLRRRIHSVFSQARTSANTAFQSATNRFQEVRSKSGIALGAAKIRLVSGSHAAIAQSRSGLQHLRENIRGTDLSGASRAWDRVRSWQVTVRIPASNKRFFSAAVESAKSSGLVVQRTLQRDSRLWASMGMAALSALLALGSFSVVRHYGPDRVEAQPTSTQAVPTAASSKAVQSNSVVSSKPSATAESVKPKPSPIAKTQASKQVAVASPSVLPKKESTAPGPQKHRARRNSEEDDYVAKDTYVFYGNSSKRSR
jgi:hypothetical protein